MFQLFFFFFQYVGSSLLCNFYFLHLRRERILGQFLPLPNPVFRRHPRTSISAKFNDDATYVSISSRLQKKFRHIFLFFSFLSVIDGEQMKGGEKNPMPNIRSEDKISKIFDLYSKMIYTACPTRVTRRRRGSWISSTCEMREKETTKQDTSILEV